MPIELNPENIKKLREQVRFCLVAISPNLAPNESVQLYTPWGCVEDVPAEKLEALYRDLSAEGRAKKELGKLYEKVPTFRDKAMLYLHALISMAEHPEEEIILFADFRRKLQQYVVCADAKCGEEKFQKLVTNNEAMAPEKAKPKRKKQAKKKKVSKAGSATKNKFVKPTLEELTEYCKEQKYSFVDPESFIFFYESKNWYIGKTKMASWRSAAGGWNSREKAKQNKVSDDYAGRGRNVVPLGKPLQGVDLLQKAGEYDEYIPLYKKMED